ncbi:hypothetical protein [Phycisphaera mikurensis]|uniref:FlgN family protein n=1 Tax=Phycisphaera mikurensis (strain NBRC 102666 / KCTC 22515 / FYK2301M01) TaxID=1142394 RepID=I0IGF1_PHYMF|nr:hypothetical protein [Phycisphaera mikurensis]MBB6440283.1 hypothetical protein [Phycisphaera mikurensis]BAM04339.1 hypothetical protein PSMK_21800 [Phycisphaera mikurensis NBRC 102666]
MTAHALPIRTDDAAEAARLRSLLERQRDEYEQLRALAEMQGDLIARRDAGALMTLLGRRQRHVDALTALNAELDPLRPRIGDVAAAGGPACRDAVRSLVDEVQRLLEEIMGLDDAGQRALAEGRDAVKAELTQAARTPRALNAYKRAAVPGATRFTNRRG